MISYAEKFVNAFTMFIIHKKTNKTKQYVYFIISYKFELQSDFSLECNLYGHKGSRRDHPCKA